MSKLKAALCGTGSDSVRPPAEIASFIASGAFILDVRTKMEAKKGMARGAVNIPLLRLKHHLDELPRDKMIVTYCGTGERAGKARDILEAASFKVSNGGSYDTILGLAAETAH